MVGLLGKKIGMTQVFTDDGRLIGVTAVEAGPCPVLSVNEKSVQLGFDMANPKKVKKPQTSFFNKINIAPRKLIREFLKDPQKEYKVGEEIKVEIFKAGDKVDVVGTSIGKGFQGGMKRWNWSGGPETHGSMHHRRVGSIGSSSEPSRIWKGHHMPGHMGAATVTVQSLRVMQVDSEHNLLVLKGAVPGHRHSYLSINKSRKKAFRSLDESKRGNVRSSKKNPMKESKAKAKGK